MSDDSGLTRIPYSLVTIRSDSMYFLETIRNAAIPHDSWLRIQARQCLGCGYELHPSSGELGDEQALPLRCECIMVSRCAAAILPHLNHLWGISAGALSGVR